MEQYSDAFGFGWATVRESTHAVVVDGEQRQAQIAVTYSVQGPPYLELIEERRGASGEADGLALTHVGFWAEDISAPCGRSTPQASRSRCRPTRRTGAH